NDVDGLCTAVENVIHRLGWNRDCIGSVRLCQDFQVQLCLAIQDRAGRRVTVTPFVNDGRGFYREILNPLSGSRIQHMDGDRHPVARVNANPTIIDSTLSIGRYSTDHQMNIACRQAGLGDEVAMTHQALPCPWPGKMWRWRIWIDRHIETEGTVLCR